jgi:Uma2 family endonuclease
MATHEPSMGPRLTLGPEDHGRAVSAEQFASADFVEPWTYEREEGRLIVMAPDGEDHVDFAERWCDALVLYKRLDRPDIVQKVVSNAWIRLDEGADRVAHIGVYLVSDQAMPPIPHRVPEIIFEIVSPGRGPRDRDYVEERRDDLCLGVREYVIIDRFKKRVTVRSYVRRSYRERVLTPADTYTSPLLPGLAIPLAEVLER